MWQLYMILMVWNGNASYGGPIVISGFKTEDACYAHAEKLKKSTPKELERGTININAKPKFEHIDCVKLEN